MHCTLCNVGLQQAAVAVVAVPAGYGAEDEARQEDGGKDGGFLIFQFLSWCWKMFSVLFQPNSKFSDLLFCILAINILPSYLYYSTFLMQIPVLF